MLGPPLATAAPVETPAAAGSGSVRTETTTFGGWTVTCQQVLNAEAKKSCIGSLRVLSQDGRTVLLSWLVGFDKDRHPMSVLQVASGLAVREDKSVSSGLRIKDGLDVKVGDAVARKIPYQSCSPQVCEAVTALDEAFAKTLGGGGPVSVIAYAADGRPIPLSFDVRGVDKAIDAVRQSQ